jgi:hypothetical protein
VRPNLGLTWNGEAEVQWLSISVHNADSPADTEKLAIELAKRAAARL